MLLAFKSQYGLALVNPFNPKPNLLHVQRFQNFHAFIRVKQDDIQCFFIILLWLV